MIFFKYLFELKRKIKRPYYSRKIAYAKRRKYEFHKPILQNISDYTKYEKYKMLQRCAALL